MTLQECYEKIGSDYEAAVGRMCGKESILEKFVRKFTDDPTYPTLISSLESGDMETAFRMAHTLKGVCLNLGFKKLYESSSALTEALRDKAEVTEEAAKLLEDVKRDYETVLSAVGEL